MKEKYKKEKNCIKVKEITQKSQLNKRENRLPSKIRVNISLLRIFILD